MTRISFFVHDLCNNPIVRAAPLAQALAGSFDVEILGFLHGDRDVYAPCGTCSSIERCGVRWT